MREDNEHLDSQGLALWLGLNHPAQNRLQM